MKLPPDLSPEALAEAMPGRPVRAWAALMSTAADAMSWARSGAPAGAVVVAEHQSSPRGRAGWPWKQPAGQGLGFSLILRPDLPPDREGWLYAVGACALADVLGEAATIEWPDEVRSGGGRAAVVSVQAAGGLDRLEWAIVNALVSEASSPRASLLARLVEAVEARLGSAPDAVLDDYLPRCATIGRAVRARLLPIGPRGAQVAGRAVTLREDGALLIETAQGNRAGVRPQSLNVLEEEASGERDAPEASLGPPTSHGDPRSAGE